MASIDSEHPLMSTRRVDQIGTLDEFHGINELYTKGDGYPGVLPYPVIDRIKKYHRIANAEAGPRKFVNIELGRFNVYSKYLNRRLSPETIRPSFVKKI